MKETFEIGRYEITLDYETELSDPYLYGVDADGRRGEIRQEVTIDVNEVEIMAYTDTGDPYQPLLPSETVKDRLIELCKEKIANRLLIPERE